MSQSQPVASLEQLLVKLLAKNGAPLPARSYLNIIGGSVVDNPYFQVAGETVGSTDVTLPSSGGGGQYNVTLANGLNSNVATTGLTVLRIGGPTAAFSVDGIVPGAQFVVLVNTTAYPLTIVDQTTSASTAANRIDCQSSGANLVLQPKTGSCQLTYDSTADRWVVQNVGIHRPNTFNVHDFGAIGDGLTDDTAAIQAAITAAQNFGGSFVEFQACTGYKHSTSLTFPAGVVHKFHPGAQLQPASGKVATFNGTIEADPQAHIFGGAGTIAFGQGSQTRVWADWWGTANLQAACTAAFANDYGIEVALHPLSTYDLGSGSVGLSIQNNNARLVGVTESTGNPEVVADNNGPLITYEGTGKAIAVGNVSAVLETMRLENFRLQTTNAATTGLWIREVDRCYFGRIVITGPGGTTTTGDGSGAATAYNRVCLDVGNSVNTIFEQIQCDGSAPSGAAAASTWGTGLSMNFGIPVTTTSFRNCRFTHCTTGAYVISAFGIFDNCVFEGNQRALDISVNSQVTCNQCWWEDNGGSGGVGGNTIAAGGYCGESICRVTTTGGDGGSCLVVINDCFVNCYPGQNYLFTISGASILKVNRGEVRFTNTPVGLSAATVTTPIVCTVAAPLYLGNCGLSQSPFYVSFTADGGNTGIDGNSYSNPAAFPVQWQVTATDDTHFTLYQLEGVSAGGSYYLPGTGSLGAGSSGAAAAAVSAVPFLFLGQVEGLTMDVEFDSLNIRVAGAACQIYPPTGGDVALTGDAFTWRNINFRRCQTRDKPRFVTTSLSAAATTTLALDSASGITYYEVTANGWFLGLSVLYTAAISSGQELDVQVFRNAGGSDLLIADTGQIAGSLAANVATLLDRAFMTTPLTKGDKIKVKVTTSTSFAVTGGNLVVELRLAEGTVLQ